MVAAEPSPEIEEIVKSAIVESLGEKFLAPSPITPGGEDFHFYKQAVSRIQSTMVGLGTDLSPGLHQPQMQFNLDALQNGVKILAISTVKIVGKD